MRCRSQVSNELSVVEKEATELFLQELIFEMSDYFLCVVNDFTSLDQRYLDKCVPPSPPTLPRSSASV